MIRNLSNGNSLELNGILSIEDNGSTMGFRSNSIYLPKDDVFVAVLTNRIYSNPDYISNKMAAIASNNLTKK